MTPQALADSTGANTDGVSNPYAVLAARLSPDELPPPRVQSGPRGGGAAALMISRAG